MQARSARDLNEDRLRGALLGLAAGDRNGGPVRMAIRLGESLVERGRFDPGDILSRYVAWRREGAFDTGPVAAMVLAHVASGVPVEDAVRRVHEASGGMTAGCNPAHRCAPLAMAMFLGDGELPGAAIREAGLTHHDPLAGDVAAAVAVLCRSLIRGEPWGKALETSAGGRSPETVRALARPDTEPLRPGGYAPDVLRAAVRFVGQHGTFEDALAASLGFAGPANYCPVLVGAIAGARWGASGIPPEALVHCGLSDVVRRLADRLAGLRSESRHPVVSREMNAIAKGFANRFARWGIRLPEEDHAAARAGHLRSRGWLIQYLFGVDESGEYLDYYASHRMTEDEHVRLHGDGRSESLPVVIGMYLSSGDPEEAKRLEQEHLHRNREVAEMLAAKGFGRFTLNMMLGTGLVNLGNQEARASQEDEL